MLHVWHPSLVHIAVLYRPRPGLAGGGPGQAPGSRGPAGIDRGSDKGLKNLDLNILRGFCLLFTCNYSFLLQMCPVVEKESWRASDLGFVCQCSGGVGG